ncbi:MULTISPECIES: GIY-YIG nuclease family protein [unclassified Luteimonas]|uniref:GIY-YIG nuclease family protein n=1 Tax=Lysobacteraceae TaxID=32033 RepID=UPI00100B1816|nr:MULTISPECIES: GIY-YIG nuclease family protein [unclassified Luteimonas]MCD9047529.1 GIY-YIG nuclease family protein [Luteimonas sp. MHLX1A]
MDRLPAVYILGSGRNGTLYIGVTRDLVARIWQHREHVVDGFTRKYDVTRLLWYDVAETMEAAIRREKQLKKWNRDWKVRLIETQNPYWNDLWPTISDTVPKTLDSRLRGNDGQGPGHGNDEQGQDHRDDRQES